MNDTFNLDLELFSDTFPSVLTPMPPPNGLQQLNGFSGDNFPPIVSIPAGLSFSFDSPFLEHPGGAQQLGWQSARASQYAESLQGDSEEAVLSFGSAVEDPPAPPSVEDLAAENTRLKAMMARMTDRMIQAESSVEPKTPPQKTKPVRAKTTPRKRPASRVADFDTTPSKRPSPRSPGTPGPIELMWSPGVTPEQRQAVYEREMRNPSSPAVALSLHSTRVVNSTFASSPAASLPATPPPKRKAAVKKPRAPRVKKTPTPKKTSTPKERTIKELWDQQFMTLDRAEKARVLLPLLQGIDPLTGTHFHQPGTMSVEQNALNAPAITSNDVDIDYFTSFMQKTATETPAKHIPEYSDFPAFLAFMQDPGEQADILSASDINALQAFNNNGQELFFNEQPAGDIGPSVLDLDNVVIDGAARQREALEQHERCIAEVRRR